MPSNHRCDRACRHGFSIVEVLVAVAVLTTGLLTAARCVEHAARAARLSERATALRAAVDTRAELLRATLCASAATTGRADSAELHLDWQGRRVGRAAYLTVIAHITPSVTSADSATLSIARWCPP